MHPIASIAKQANKVFGRGSDSGPDGGVGHPSDSTYYNNIVARDVPEWLLGLLGVGGGEGVLRFASHSLSPSSSPDWNRLVSLSWRVVRGRGAGSLVPDERSFKFVGLVREGVAKGFGFGRWVEVVGGPRTGKSAGVSLGVIEWIVKNDLPNYTVLIVAPNSRLAVNLYRYFIGASAKVYKELRRGGVKISRGDFYEKVRVRLYLGGERSCLLGKRIHFIEDCVSSCPLFKQYGGKWRKMPPVPVLDPWILKISGYCPFVSSFSKEFWYKSVVIVNSSSLWFAISNIIRHGIRRVVLIFDEYLVHLMRRGMVKKIDVKKLEKVFGDILDEEFDVEVVDSSGKQMIMKVSLRRLIERWNELVDALDRAAVEFYSNLDVNMGGEWKGLRDLKGLAQAEAIVDSILYRVRDMSDVVDDESGMNVVRILLKMYSVGLVIDQISDKIPDVKRRMVLKRLGRYLATSVMGVPSAVEVGGGRGIIINLRWTRVNGEEYIVGYVGGVVRSVVEYLLNHGVLVGVITTSVDDSKVQGISIVPYERFEHFKISVDGVYKFVKYYGEYMDFGAIFSKDRKRIVTFARDLNKELDFISRIPGNSVLILNKKLMFYCGSYYRSRGLEVGVYGDLDRGVVDYLIVDKRNGGKILVTSPWSRVSMGVDPPVENPTSVYIVYGLRRPSYQYIKFRRGTLHLVVTGPFGVLDFSKYRGYGDDVYYVYAGSDSRFDYLKVYDVFDYKFDVHMLVQVIGRWFMQSLGVIFFNRKYKPSVKYIIFDFEVHNVPVSPFYAVIDESVDKKRIEDLGYRVYDDGRYGYIPLKNFNEGLDFIMKYFGVSLEGSERRVARRYMRLSYLTLRGIYNSLRYIKKQVRFRQLHDGDIDLIVRKIVMMVNGFRYAEEEGLDVPDGLKKLYRVYWERGVGGILEWLKEWWGIDDDTMKRIVERVMKIYNIYCGILEYKYGLRPIDRKMIIVGVNDKKRDLSSYARR